MPLEGRLMPLLWRKRTHRTGLSQVQGSQSSHCHCDHRIQTRIHRLKKIVRNPREKASQAEGCVDQHCVANYIRLNTSALSDPDSLCVNLLFPTSSVPTKMLNVWFTISLFTSIPLLFYLLLLVVTLRIVSIFCLLLFDSQYVDAWVWSFALL